MVQEQHHHLAAVGAGHEPGPEGDLAARVEDVPGGLVDGRPQLLGSGGRHLFEDGHGAVEDLLVGFAVDGAVDGAQHLVAGGDVREGGGEHGRVEGRRSRVTTGML